MILTVIATSLCATINRGLVTVDMGTTGVTFREDYMFRTIPLIASASVQDRITRFEWKIYDSDSTMFAN